ncbi:MAG: serine/threonine protein kinase, partial [Roseateles sp.]|uniref:serine/threonine protein kinase n=2 Tax=Roseateles sp. TaxID=1971397 RepID=UPI004036C43E
MRMPNLSLPPPAAAAPLEEGQAMGVWRLVKPLPDGEQAHAGQWYSAHHAMATEALAAVLVLDRSDHGAGVMLRYADQAGDLAKLQHPHIAVPSDSGVTPDAHPYLIVEGTHGEPLLPKLEQLGLRERIELLVQLCEALRSAHQQGWLLAEIDPAMIWLDPAGNVRLMGLGLTKIPDPTDPFDRGLSLGASPAFIAPERRNGEPPTLASEVYGLGALARLLVCGWEDTPKGLAPLRGSAGDPWPALKQAQQVKLDTLLRAAMAESPELRTRGAEGLADELRDWLRLSPSHNAGNAASTGAPAEPAAKPAWWKRWLWLGAAAGLGLLAVAANVSEPPGATASA